MKLTDKVLENQKNYRVAFIVAIVILVLGMYGALSVRLIILDQGKGASHSVQDQPKPQYTRNPTLAPPTTGSQKADKPVDYGSSIPVALEVVDAFLKNDQTRFNRLAAPALASDVGGAELRPPNQKIVGKPEIIANGPTQQTVKVPTSTGDLELIMAIEFSDTGAQGAWIAQEMRYK